MLECQSGKDLLWLWNEYTTFFQSFLCHVFPWCKVYRKHQIKSPILKWKSPQRFLCCHTGLASHIFTKHGIWHFSQKVLFWLHQTENVFNLSSLLPFFLDKLQMGIHLNLSEKINPFIQTISEQSLSCWLLLTMRPCGSLTSILPLSSIYFRWTPSTVFGRVYEDGTLFIVDFNNFPKSWNYCRLLYTLLICLGHIWIALWSSCDCLNVKKGLNVTVGPMPRTLEILPST